MAAPAPRLFWGILVFLALLVGYFGFRVIRDGRTTHTVDTTDHVPDIIATDPVRGASNAAVTIIEYGDFQCPYCRTEQPAVMVFLAKYPSQVRLVWKDFPLADQHAEALPAAKAARCAQEQGAFWAMHDALYAHQNELASSLYPKLATEIGINVAAFQSCLASDRPLALITASRKSGESTGVDGTPLYFIGTERVSTFPSAADLDQYMQQHQRE
ncbi:MAG: thioredoxin domain-containing protein [bacterium]